MAENPYLARLRELAPQVNAKLEAEFPATAETEHRMPNLRPLDPSAAYLVLISKLGAISPALAAAILLMLIGPFAAPVPPITAVIVLLLTSCAYVAVSAVSRMEATAGLWKRPQPSEPASISSLRFMGLHFYPARISSLA